MVMTLSMRLLSIFQSINNKFNVKRRRRMMMTKKKKRKK